MKFQHYTIRQLSSRDLDPYYSMVDKNRKRLEDFFAGTVSRTQTKEDTDNLLSDLMQRIEVRTYFPYVIIDDNTQSFIGFMDLKNIDWNIPKAEMGLYIDEDYSGKGISAEAFSLFCEHSFKQYGFNKLYLRTHETNTAARKLAEKTGFELEGKIRMDYKTTSGKLVDLLYYGRVKAKSLNE